MVEKVEILRAPQTNAKLNPFFVEDKVERSVPDILKVFQSK